MLNDEVIDRLIQPIIDRQEAINIYVIQIIAKRVKQIGKLLPSDAYKLRQLLKSGVDVKKINKALAQITNQQVKDIQKLIRIVAEDGYADLKPFFDYRNKPYPKFEDNKDLMNNVNAMMKETEGTFTNLSNSTAFMIRDPKNRSILKPTSVTKTYYSVIDEAVQAVQSGVLDYNTAMRKTINQLIDSGLRRVDYSPESGRRYTQRLDTAVRRNIIDAVRKMSQLVQDIVGEQFGADGKEISVHVDSAPDHEPIQGRQFSLKQYERLNNEQSFRSYGNDVQKAVKFKPLKRGIGQWNCRHFAFSIILGVMDPNYTDDQLDEMHKENMKGYTLPNGRHMTRYECTQYMRQLETNIRYAKEGQVAFKTSGDMKTATKYENKVNNLNTEYSTFCRATRMRPKWDRTFVSYYKALKKDEYEY